MNKDVEQYITDTIAPYVEIEKGVKDGMWTQDEVDRLLALPDVTYAEALVSLRTLFRLDRRRVAEVLTNLIEREAMARMDREREMMLLYGTTKPMI